MPTYNSCTKRVGSPGLIHAQLPTIFLGMDAWITSQLNIALICKLCVSLMCLTYLFDVLSMGVCTTRHWQTSGELVQELNVCTVCVMLNVFSIK